MTHGIVIPHSPPTHTLYTPVLHHHPSWTDGTGRTPSNFTHVALANQMFSPTTRRGRWGRGAHKAVVDWVANQCFCTTEGTGEDRSAVSRALVPVLSARGIQTTDFWPERGANDESRAISPNSTSEASRQLVKIEFRACANWLDTVPEGGKNR